jgi:hypothetical protein
MDSAPDLHLAFTFLLYYQRFEQILLRAGFTREGRRPGNLRADWERFARHIQAKFDPEADLALSGSVGVLLRDPDNPELYRNRGREFFLQEPIIPERNTVWLAELVREVRNRILYGILLTGVATCEMAQVSAALFLLGSWAYLDPALESLWADVEQC